MTKSSAGGMAQAMALLELRAHCSHQKVLAVVPSQVLSLSIQKADASPSEVVPNGPILRVLVPGASPKQRWPPGHPESASGHSPPPDPHLSRRGVVLDLLRLRSVDPLEIWVIPPAKRRHNVLLLSLRQVVLSCPQGSGSPPQRLWTLPRWRFAFVRWPLAKDSHAY